ncbi:MAG: DUF3810 domain-containing protein [Clostridia bacterium]|nr:DUF3810 domain-containing protein [Clostridia bacterium]
MIKTAYRKLRRYVPTVAIWTFVLTALCAVIHTVAKHSRPFADFMNFKVNHVFRGLLAHLTGWLPFSLAEALILAIPVIAIVLVVLCIRVAKKSWRHVIRYVSGILAIICYFYISFVLTYGIGYVTTPVEDVLGLDRRDVSATELKKTADILTEEINSIINEIDFAYAGFSHMPYSLNEMSAKLCDAYESFCEKYPHVNTFRSRIKPVALSEPLTYTHLSGIYSYMTGESNLNVNYPDYILPSTAAHEMSHQRGFAREDEASFIAFLVSMESDDPYIRYSAAIDVYSYVINALYQANPNMYFATVGNLDYRAQYEKSAFYSFFEKYQDNVVAETTDKINDAYLQIQGTVGTRSYGMVVDLTVAYYRSMNWQLPEQ